MTMTSQKNGHKIVFNDKKEEWEYEDGKPTNKPKKCPKCNCKPNKKGHDHCLGELTGVINACCGHGVNDGYIQFENGTEITFELKSVYKNDEFNK